MFSSVCERGFSYTLLFCWSSYIGCSPFLCSHICLGAATAHSCFFHWSHTLPIICTACFWSLFSLHIFGLVSKMTRNQTRWFICYTSIRSCSHCFWIFSSFQLGSPQQKPKRLRVLADVSGSMYRFNGVDGRLERSMEAVCMVMEALESYEHKFKVTCLPKTEFLWIKLCSAWWCFITLYLHFI